MKYSEEEQAAMANAVMRGLTHKEPCLAVDDCNLYVIAVSMNTGYNPNQVVAALQEKAMEYTGKDRFDL